MSTVEKVSVSLPAALLARVESRRLERGTSRSDVVSELLWRGWHQVENEERERRYSAAYRMEPDSGEERAWAETAATDLLDGSDAGWEAADDDAAG
ncbi:MAG: hypothetical protein ACRDYD_13580 [Acidimicrobiales bacterium]